MAVARSHTVSLVGLSAQPVDVEADISQGLPGFVLTGCFDPTLREARERVRAATTNTGAEWPNRRIVVGLSPAAVTKRGGALDMAIAAAVLAAAGTVPVERLAGTVLLGELGLDGSVRAVSGVLPSVLGAVRAGFGRFVVPAANAAEARLVADSVIGVACLRDVLAWLCTGEVPDVDEPAPATGPPATAPAAVPDLADVVGQDVAVRALEVAAAGGHHVLLVGLPGVGKTMLAERLPGLLPALDADSALQVTAIHSVAGILPAGAGLVTTPPFCAPHHTSTTAALIGGGSRLALPGAASIAHRGVLFLDEAPEFGPRSLDALRQPLESGEVVIGRSGGVTRYPARFQLVVAANPCGCAIDTDTAPSSLAPSCSCSVVQRQRYTARMSGPLVDRIDIRLRLGQPSAAMLGGARSGPTSDEVRARVSYARDRATRRLAGTGWTVTGDVPGSVMRQRWPANPDGAELLDGALTAGRVSPRGLDRVLRVAWSIADLSGHDRPDAADVQAALELRQHATGGGFAATADLRRSA